MRLNFTNIQGKPVDLLRRAGYIFRKKEKGELSFIRPLGRAGYPRFHIYAKIKNYNLTINIHFDQKRETYGKNKRHHGEYKDNEFLEKEVERIKKIIEQNI